MPNFFIEMLHNLNLKEFGCKPKYFFDRVGKLVDFVNYQVRVERGGRGYAKIVYILIFILIFLKTK